MDASSDTMASNPQALEVLQAFPGTKLEQLYRQPSTALAVFRRMLPHLAKTIVMAMLYMPNPFQASDLDSWIRPDAVAEKEQALVVLTGLHIITTALQTQGPRAYLLGKVFAKSLRQALTGGGDHKSFGVPCEPKDNGVDVEFLDNHARRQWEDILYYMVGSTSAGLGGQSRISSGTKSLLELGNFVDKRGRITQTGFTFLLQEVNAQVWSLLIVYLNQAPLLKMDSVDILSFIFMLGSLELGQAYSTATLSSTQLQMLDDLADFGIVYRPSARSPSFYPTRLATTLTSDATALRSTAATTTTSAFSTGLDASAASAGKGYIIVETNYRLYAYTSSILQISVLNLFTRLTTRFPNLVTGRLTKTSVQRAIAQGITADQIISYLSSHAHPQMRKSAPVLPPTVVDQIRLWQIEGDRMTTTEGYMMVEFGTEQEYRDAVAYAETLGLLVWKSDTRRCFFVSRIEQIRSFLANRRARQ